MTDAVNQGLARIPTYAEVLDALASGFGLIEAKDQKLLFQRSWQGRQARFGPNTNKPWRGANQGRIGELLMLLSGDAPDIADELGSFLDNAETLLSFMRAKGVFTRKTYRSGLAAFLGIIVFPQLALFLCHIRARLPESSPLHYLFDLLPDIDVEAYDCAKNTRRAVREQLEKIVGVSVADFKRSISKITEKSDIKLKTIEDQMNCLKFELETLGDHQGCNEKVKAIRAAYIAGVAVQRFIGKLSGGAPSIASVRFFGNIKYWMNVFSKEDEGAVEDGFAKAHRILSLDLAGIHDRFSEDCLDASIEEVLGVFCRHLDARSIEECPPILDAYKMLLSADPDTVSIRESLNLLEQHEDSYIFKPVHNFINARLQMIEGDEMGALARFWDVVNHSEMQQVGEIAEIAASYAISLEIKKAGRWVNGCLDPLIVCIAQNKRQTIWIETQMPTPFGSLCDAPKITESERLIFDAVSMVNNIAIGSGSDFATELCNPFEKLDKYLSRAIGEFRVIHNNGGSEEKAMEEAISLVFNRRVKSQSIFRVPHARPYDAVRDIFFYTQNFFGEMGLEIHMDLNPGIIEYISLSADLQLVILRALDEERFCEDYERNGGGGV
ncbi:TPA: hypothetical protein N2B25_002667 [Pseudomonas aeruginosa]|nr:hypothetical protein [Pseudomonas aeruginosa]HCL3885034.1 hypothetical protein [Pseudomonas aeruginosa]